MSLQGKWLWAPVVWQLLAGLMSSAGAATVFDMDARWRWLKGTGEASQPDTTAWRQRGFDDRGWAEGTAPFYYGEPLVGTELPDMRGNYSCVYFRKTFVIRDPAEIASVQLRALSDDGFVAWINGREAVRFNVPGGDVIPYGSVAGQSFNEPLPTETYDIPNFREMLVVGTNVVAVQGFNNSLGNSSDFVFQAALDVTIDEQAPRVLALNPAAGSRVLELLQVQVTFDEPVDGVDAADLRINGAAATRLTPFGPDTYVFEFPAAPRGTVSMAWVAGHGIRDRSTRANPFAGGSWTYVVDPDLPPPGVSISEFMADNDRTLNDEDGDASDWIELHNSAEQAVHLGGWTLTDDATQPGRWRVPSVTLPARGYLVVFASGKNRTNVTGRLHTNFRLSGGGGYLALARPGGAIASQFASYPAQQEDVSYGRLPTDPTRTGFFPVPTPGAVNGEGGPGFAPGVEFSRIGGTFVDAFSLRLTAGGAVVRYTLDGTVPTEASPALDGASALTIAASTRVRARSFAAGLLPGPLRGEYYVQLTPAGAAVTSTLPLVVIHSFGRGSVPANGEYPAFLAVHEPRGGSASLTNAPDLRTRVRLNIRGSSTLGQPKRNYSVEFRDEREADRDLSPLGLPAESDWILYAPNNFEPILIHNPLAFQMSRELGRYAPRTRFVEVYVQTAVGSVSTAQYAGIYVLMEKIKRGPDRVDIEALEPEHSAVPAVTGGYMLKVDRLDPGDGGLYAGFQAMGFVEPKEEEMNTAQRAPQRTYIQNYLDQFGQALYAADWRDPVRGWRAYVDQPSWIDHHLLNVVAFNVDALRLSAYFYKPRGGKLEFGPAWDFDRALYSTDGRDQNPKIWRSGVGDQGTDFFNYTWWGRMFEDPDFFQAYIDRYQEVRQGAFSTNRLFALIDELVAEVRPAQPREAARWNGFTSPRLSYESEVSSLKNWLGRRLEFMDTNFLAAPVLGRAGGTVTSGTTVALTGPTGATLYYTTDGSDPRAPGGAVATTARVYAAPIPITTTTVLRARSFRSTHRNLTGPNNPPISSSWSGTATARYGLVPAPAAGSLVVTELNYQPAEPTAAELAVNPLLTRGDFEFIEILNTRGAAVDLTGLRFTSGVEFSFRTSSIPTLAGQARLLLVRNQAAFTLRHGDTRVVAGEYQGGLDASGETLRIEDAAGQVILEARYRNGWHPATDGLGFTLVAADQVRGVGTGPGGGASGWRPSAAPGGSPARLDPAAPDLPVVVINEALTHTDLPMLDAVELANLSDRPASIGGWWLTDDRAVPRRYRIPAGTVVPAGGFLWIDESAFNADTNAPTSFRLDSLGDSVWLFAADPATGALLGPAHGFAFGAAANGVSFGRDLGCAGDERFVPQAAVTPGAPNAGARRSAVVVTEVHYHPPDIRLGTTLVDDTALEFVEIANVGDTLVPLYDPLHATNTWRLKDAVGFRFPQGLSLEPGRLLVVVNFDPDRNPSAVARFRSAFGIGPEVPLLGPLEGSLANSGGSVELARPDAPQLPSDPQPGLVPMLVVDRVSYGDTAPWPVGADGGGHSLQRVLFDAWGDEPRLWVAQPPTPGRLPPAGLDSDADGMGDAWEAGYCFDPGNPADGALDSDGDGILNRDEYRAGTDPHGASPVVAWQSIRLTPAGVELRFLARRGASYTVQSTDRLGSGAWTRFTDFPATTADGVVTLRTPLDGTGPRFFRLVTPALP